MRILPIAGLAAPLACALIGAAPALAQATNLGFETDTLAGWSRNSGDAFVSNTLSNSDGGSIDAAHEGDLFGAISAGLGEGTYTTLSRSFSLQAGGTISGYAAFLANDYAPYDDDAYLSINGTNLLAWDITGAGHHIGVGDYQSSGWIYFTFIAPTEGLYTLQLGVTNRMDNNQSSQAAIDGVQVTGGVVPEPASWAMMVMGFGLAGMALRTRRRTLSFG